MSKTFDDLCDQIEQNAVKDRKRLEGYLDQVGKASIGDPEIAAALAESIVDVSEVLTKNNAQLVLLAQLRLKKELEKSKKDGDDFGENESEEMFDEIEDDLDAN